jgi:cytochrome c551
MTLPLPRTPILFLALLLAACPGPPDEDSGDGSGTDSGQDSGTDSGEDSGTDSGDSGTDSGADSGDSGTDSGGDTGAPDGAALFATHCSSCHGADGRGGTERGIDGDVPDLSDAEIIEIILNGKGDMSAIAVTEPEAAAIVAHLRTLFP